MSAQYFAQINGENIVTNVAVVTTEFMAANPKRYTGTWVETFFDRADKRYAGIGFIYDPVKKDFIEPTYPPIVR
jgi:hypothetical protein